MNYKLTYQRFKDPLLKKYRVRVYVNRCFLTDNYRTIEQAKRLATRLIKTILSGYASTEKQQRIREAIK